MIYHIDRLGVRRKPEICAVCGKRFEHSPEHVFKQTYGGRVLYACSWTCRKKQLQGEQKGKRRQEAAKCATPEALEARIAKCRERMEFFRGARESERPRQQGVSLGALLAGQMARNAGKRAGRAEGGNKMSEITISRQRAVDCVLRASQAYAEQGDDRVAAVLRGVAGAVGAIEPERQKPLTLKELRRLPHDEVVWEEWRREEFAALSQTYGCVLAHMCIHHGKKSPYIYGQNVRAWRRLPTDEERAAAEWEEGVRE